MSTILNATEVTVRYGEQAILDAATLAIDEGQRIGLVGRNGCGKSTFLKLLAGLQPPDGGMVTRRNGCGKSTFLKLLAGLQQPDGGMVTRRNGCGKSTFLKLLAGLQPPDGGMVT